MKRTLNGSNAMLVMMQTALPEKTESYTPIAHSDILVQLRSAVFAGGMSITGEQYRATDNGQVASGTIQVSSEAHPDLELGITFLNSYNKQHRFMFSTNGIIKANGGSIFLPHEHYDAYRRVHTGEADKLAADNIAAQMAIVADFWEELKEYKDFLCAAPPLEDLHKAQLIGHMFMEDVLNTAQMSEFREQMLRPKFIYGDSDKSSPWAIYGGLAHALSDTHPADWITRHRKAFQLFTDFLSAWGYVTLPKSNARSIPGVQEENGGDASAGTAGDTTDDAAVLAGGTDAGATA